MILFRKTFLLWAILIALSSVEAQKIDSIKKIRPTVALVLSGGGAKGFAEIGTLEAIDELGIPIDYIVGTSMGSIMGGLYAIGYSGRQIAEEVARQDWNTIFTDATASSKTSISIKDELSRYIFSFPMRGGIRLPQGIVRGQQVMNILSKYTIGYHNDRDFFKFPIPYSCVATDLETGEAIVFDKGSLPQSMRASMAIPSIFTPVEIGDRIFIDGGTVNNFPTDVAKAKGIDYIIGVDVQSGLRKRENLNSAIDITNQLVTLLGKNRNDENIKLADVYIHPNISKYSTSSFTPEEIDSLIVIGRRAAKMAYPKLRKLKEQLGKNIQKQQLSPPKFNQQFRFNAIEINGLEESKEKLFLQKIRLNIPDSITAEQLNKKMGDVSAALNLDLLTYKLNKDTLTFSAHERNSRRFNVGTHYDSDNNAAVLLNTTWDNLLLKNSRTSLDAILSENLQFTARYSLRIGNIPHINFVFDTKQYGLALYNENDKITEADISYVKFDINTQAILWDNYTGGIGIRKEYVDISNELSSVKARVSGSNGWYTNTYAFIRLNTLDNTYYPKKGLRFNGEVKYVSNDSGSETGTVIYADYQRAVSLSKKLVATTSFYGRAILDNELNDVYSNFWGGINPSKYFDNHLPFMGANWVQGYDNNAMVIGRLDLYYELFRNNYLVLTGNYGRNSNAIENLLKDEAKNIWGGGITYSYNSIIGPIAFTGMYSTEVKKPLFNVSIGFNF